MRLRKLASCLVLAIAALVVLSSSAASEESPCAQDSRAQGQSATVESPQEQSSAPQDKEKASGDAVRLPVYKPPLRGAPTSRVAGGARGFAFWSLDGKLVEN